MEYCKSIPSSSSTARKYDVFVSFRGEDVRNNFADHLFAAFQRKGVVAFRDDTNLKQGDHISTELEEAIEASQVLIAVFSKNYATSTWCLQELSKFVDCIHKAPPTGQILLPVFYDVTPSDVRKQSGEYFGKAFAELEERFKDNLEMVQRWREALKQAANLCGQEVQNKPQHKEIENIVERVINIAGYKLSSFDDLVGMNSRVEQLEKLLDLDSNDVVRVVGIHGMGGIGKTTLARAVHDKNLNRYDASCFIDDMSKVYRDHGSIGAQKQLICEALNEENQVIWNVSKATALIRTRLPHVKAFIVLDNVDKYEQLEKLGVNRECLRAGSRIVVVSRDRHILDNYGVDEVYNVELLNDDEARELFCRKAFKSGHILSCDDICYEYEALTDLVLKYAQGLPLAIEVLGSFLYGKNVSEWQSALARLRDSPNKDIMDVLQISFDGLEPKEKEIFLDIACFFDNHEVEFVKRILDCCGFDPIIGIKVLVDKSLITIQGFEVRMHDKLKELGWKIVRQKAPNEPRKWSRLWLLEDFQNVMYLKMAMDNLEAINLESFHKTIESATLRAEALSRMSRLRFLSIDSVSFSGSFTCLSNDLRYLYWRGYPFTYFPSSCELSKLVELHLTESSIKQLWEGVKPMYNLKVMDLSLSENLVKTPDFCGTPNLEELYLRGCTELVHIHPSIGKLEKLVFLYLSNCSSLTGVSNSIFCLSSLEVLNMQGCSKSFNSGLLENARDTAIQCVSKSSIFKRIKLMLPSIDFLNSRRHADVVGSLKPSSLFRSPCLREVDLSYCNLVNIPDAMAELCCLERLELEGNKFVTLPSFLMQLPRLTWLNLDHCKQLTFLSEFPLRSTVLPTEEAHWWEVALRMFNCPKFIEMGSCWSSAACSWMIEFLKLHKESSPDISILIPGTEIPSWFNHQSVGHSIKAEPIPSSNWIGVAVCAAFVVKYDCSSFGIIPEIKCRLSRMGYAYEHTVIFNRVGKVEKALGELVLLCLDYVGRQQLTLTRPTECEGMHDLDGLCFELLSGNYDSQHVKVKHCGLRLVCKQDLEEVNRDKE